MNETTKSDFRSTFGKPAKESNDSKTNSRSISKTFEVVIAGVPLRLKSSHDEQTVNELVSLVDSKIREALPLTKTGSIQNASILASLNLAEEYLMLKRKTLSELDGLEAKAQKAISEMESSGARPSRLETAENSLEN